MRKKYKILTTEEKLIEDLISDGYKVNSFNGKITSIETEESKEAIETKHKIKLKEIL